MTKMAAAVAVVFAVGAGAMSMFGAVLGGTVEAAALGLVGTGLVASSYILGNKAGAKAQEGTAAAARRVGNVA